MPRHVLWKYRFHGKLWEFTREILCGILKEINSLKTCSISRTPETMSWFCLVISLLLPLNSKDSAVKYITKQKMNSNVSKVLRYVRHRIFCHQETRYVVVIKHFKIIISKININNLAHVKKKDCRGKPPRPSIFSIQCVMHTLILIVINTI